MPASDGGTREYVDRNLMPDTAYSYRVGAFNANGENQSAIRGAFTRAAVDEPVWRVQLAVSVSNRDDANMDDSLQVRLNGASSHFIPSLNSTWLDYGRDDFERGSFFIYDLNMERVSQRSDITQIMFQHEGSDAVCIDAIGLFVNGVSVYARDFAAEGGCLWLDDSDTFRISHEELRADARWQTYVTPFPPLVITRAELESRIEGLVGDMLHTTDAYWGDRDGRAFVEASFVDPQRVKITLDLKGDVNNLPDPEIDVSFNLAVSVACAADGEGVSLTVTTEDFDANVDTGILGTIVDFLTPIPVGLGLPCEGGLARCLERKIEKAIESQFIPISLAITADADICNAGFEPTVDVTENADIWLGVRQTTTFRQFDFSSFQNFVFVDAGNVPESVMPTFLAAPTPSEDQPVLDDPTQTEEVVTDAADSDEGTPVADPDLGAGDSPIAEEASNQTSDSDGASGGLDDGDGAAVDDLNPIPFGCGGPMLMNALMLCPALLSMRRGRPARRA